MLNINNVKQQENMKKVLMYVLNVNMLYMKNVLVNVKNMKSDKYIVMNILKRYILGHVQQWILTYATSSKYIEWWNFA